MAKVDPALKKLRKICLALPDTKETLTWDKPHFRVGDKISCGFGEEDGKFTTGFNLKNRIRRSSSGCQGFQWRNTWVSLDVHYVDDWNEVADMIHESYRLIAPKTSLAKLSDEKAVPKTPVRKKTSASGKRKTATKQVSKKKSLIGKSKKKTPRRRR